MAIISERCRRGWIRAALCLAGIAAAPAGAQAPAAGVVLGVEIRPEMAGRQVEIPGCPEYLGIGLTGREAVFRCESRPLYEVRIDGRPAFVGYQRLRELAPRPASARGPAPPPPGPLRVMALVASEGEAIAAYDRLGERERPRDLPSRAGGLGPAPAAAAPAADAPAADAPAATAAAPAAPTDGRRRDLTIRLVSEGAFGRPAVAVGRLMPAGSDPDDPGLALWDWRVPAEAAARPVRVFLEDRPACGREVVPMALAQRGEAVPLDPGCTAYPLALPEGFAPAAAGCARAADEEVWRCLLAPDEREVAVGSEIWGPAQAALVGSGALRLDPGTLRPPLPVALGAAVSGGAEGRCAMPEISVALAGYCGPEGCVAAPGGALPLAPGAAGTPGPSLAEAGWTGAELPTGARLSVAMGEAAPSDLTVSFGAEPVDLAAALGVELPTRRLPLRLEMAAEGYADDRELRVFADPDCTAPFPDARKLLYFRGTESPEVPACGYFKVFEAGRPRSICAPLEVSEDGAAAVAEAEVVACDDRRLVIMVVQNATLSGSLGRAISTALETVLREAREAGECLPVDLVRTASADREALVSGEDVLLAREFDGLLPQPLLEFINSASQPFEDFNWIERTYGDKLGGVIFFLDATQPAPATALDAPAAVLWFANDLFRWVFNAAGEAGCDGYAKLLRMSDCEPIDTGFDAARLREVIDLGLEKMRETE